MNLKKKWVSTILCLRGRPGSSRTILSHTKLHDKSLSKAWNRWNEAPASQWSVNTNRRTTGRRLGADQARTLNPGLPWTPKRAINQSEADPRSGYVQFASSLRSIRFWSSYCSRPLRVWWVSPARLSCVRAASTQHPRRARSVCFLCPMSVHAAFTLRSLWFIRKWATLAAEFTQSADWVDSTKDMSLHCTV